MTARLQLRRGTTSEMDSFTGAEGEPTFDVDKGTIVVHDGVTQGGITLARSDAQELNITTDDIAEGTNNLYWIEAPLDGQQYIRKDGSWIVGDFTSYTSSDFTSDFNTKTTDDLSEGSTNLYWIEAPTDGSQYVRQNSSWVEISTSGGSVSLGVSSTSDSVTVTNSGGTDATITGATTTNAGVMTASAQTFNGIKTFQDELRCESDIVAFYSSDSRLKENINDLNGALDNLDKIRGVEYDWTDEYLESRGGEDETFARKHDVGVIAQELQEVLPEAVSERPDGYLGVRYEKIVPLLVQAIKELKSEVTELKQER